MKKTMRNIIIGISMILLCGCGRVTTINLDNIDYIEFENDQYQVKLTESQQDEVIALMKDMKLRETTHACRCGELPSYRIHYKEGYPSLLTVYGDGVRYDGKLYNCHYQPLDDYSSAFVKELANK